MPIAKETETWRIESEGVMVTSGPYNTKRAAQSAADAANRLAPEQRWRPVPESEYPRPRP